MSQPPIDSPTVITHEVIKPLIKPDRPNFNKRARTEAEAAVMAWELYSYIRELEYSIDAYDNIKTK